MVYALVLLGFPTLVATLTLQQYAQWRAGYEREIRTQQALMQDRYQRWLDEHSD